MRQYYKHFFLKRLQVVQPNHTSYIDDVHTIYRFTLTIETKVNMFASSVALQINKMQRGVLQLPSISYSYITVA